jgi:hypothetical protein
MTYEGPLAISEVGLSSGEIERARLPDKPKEASDPHRCVTCNKQIEADGFCSWHGPLHEQWLCDDHVHELRSRGQELRPKQPMTREAVETAIAITEGALRNMAMIDEIKARDASCCTRGFELSLTWRQSRPIIKAILDVLKVKLTAFPPPAPVVEEVDPE